MTFLHSHNISFPVCSLYELAITLQAAAKKRSRRHQAETDEFILSNNDGALMDPTTLSISYQKMKFLILSIKNEIFTDIEIHNQNVLPR